MNSTRLKIALAVVLVFVLIGTRADAFAHNPRGAFDTESLPTEIVVVPTRPNEPVTDPTESVARIAGHIKDNYARLHTVRATLQTTSLDRSVTKREEVTFQQPDGGIVHYVRDPSKERYRCEFDPARNDLPTRIVVFRDEDKIGIVLDISYEEVIPGTAWFFKKATHKFFGPDLARSPDSEAWRQALIVETMGKVIVNRPIPADAFLVRLPEGTRVSDAVHSSHD
jgi:hypothetical protein